jgi:PRD1 phage membrane DNA delivery
MSQITEAGVTICLAIIGLGIVSVLVSRKAQTPAVIQAAGSAFGNSLAVAEAPVTGANTPITLAYPSSGFGGVMDFSSLTPTPYG